MSSSSCVTESTAESIFSVILAEVSRRTATNSPLSMSRGPSSMRIGTPCMTTMHNILASVNDILQTTEWRTTPCLKLKNRPPECSEMFTVSLDCEIIQSGSKLYVFYFQNSWHMITDFNCRYFFKQQCIHTDRMIWLYINTYLKHSVITAFILHSSIFAIIKPVSYKLQHN